MFKIHHAIGYVFKIMNYEQKFNTFYELNIVFYFSL